MPSDLPIISIVIPNFNGGKTIARTIQSIIDQQYPNKEIIVMDGGSSDNSVEVIKSFEHQIAFWASAKDKGQSDAINRGFGKSTGEVLNWLCSDDVLLPGALEKVGAFFSAHPDIDVLAGTCKFIYLSAGREQYRYVTPETLDLMPIICTVGQPACFYRRRTLDRTPPVREDLHYCMDLELWCHFKSAGRRWACTDDNLAIAYEDGANKTSTGGLKIVAESERVYRQYSREWIPMPFWYRHLQYPLRKFMQGTAPAPLRSIVRQLRRSITVMLSPFYGMQRLRTLECWYQHFEPESDGVSTQAAAATPSVAQPAASAVE